MKRILIAAAAGVLAAGAAPAGARTAPRGIHYGGPSSEDDPVVFVLTQDRRHVATISEEFSARCASGGGVTWLGHAPGPLRISAAGRFSGQREFSATVGENEADVTIEIRARVQGPAMTGSIDATVRILDAQGQATDTCTASATFRDAAKKGKVYAGFTSQGGPVVAELDARRRRIHHLHIGWRSTCTNGGGFQYGDTVLDLPLVGTTFAGSFTQQFGEPPGEHETDAYTLKGTITRARLSGSIAVRTRDFDGSGALTADCDTGTVTFRGASG